MQNLGLQSQLQTKPWTAKLNLGPQKTPQKIALGVESEALGAESEALGALVCSSIYGIVQ